MKAFIFANGDVNDGVMVRRALRQRDDSALCIAADGGARAAIYYALPLHAVVGDMDSIGDDLLAALRADGVEIHAYPAEKNETDLELALMLAAARGADWIRVLGGIGDRLDQTLANLLLLALPACEGRDVRLVAGKQEIWLLRPGDHTLTGDAGDTLSLLPLGGDAVNVRTDGLYYPLRGETLRFGPARGISNLFSAETARVAHDSGVLLVVHTVGRA